MTQTELPTTCEFIDLREANASIWSMTSQAIDSAEKAIELIERVKNLYGYRETDNCNVSSSKEFQCGQNMQKVCSITTSNPKPMQAARRSPRYIVPTAQSSLKHSRTTRYEQNSSQLSPLGVRGRRAPAVIDSESQ